MSENMIYYVLGTVAVMYLLLSMNNKRKGKKRKSRGFMSDYKRKQKGE